MELNGLQKVFNEDGTEDRTLLKATFILLETDVESWNGEVITEEEALKMAKSMKYKPLTCQYFRSTAPDGNMPNDHFGSHGEYKEKFRYGGEYTTTNSFAIGVARDGAYLSIDTDENGLKHKYLKCDFYLWVTRYLNICSLIEDIWNSGEPLYSSCEYRYRKEDANIIDGVRYPKNLIFEGHCILGSRQDGSIVRPAFDNSRLVSFNERWEKSINEIIEKERSNKMVDNKENISEDNKDEKVKNENTQEVKDSVEEDERTDNDMSLSDAIRSLRNEIEKALGENCFLSSSEIFSDYVVVETWDENGNSKYIKIPFTNGALDFEHKQEVRHEDMWVPVSNVVTLNSKVSELEKTNKELNSQKEELEKQVKELTEVNKSLNEKYSKATEKVTSAVEEVKTLNEKIAKLQEVEKQFNEANDKAELKKKMDYYKEKFMGLNSIEKFNEDETQKLIKKSIKDSKAKEELNDLVMSLIPSFNEKKDSKILPSSAEKVLNESKEFELPEEQESAKSDFDKKYTL